MVEIVVGVIPPSLVYHLHVHIAVEPPLWEHKQACWTWEGGGGGGGRGYMYTWVPVKAGMQEPGMEPGTVCKGSSQEFFLLSCASIQIQAACLLHLQIPIAHCLPPAPHDTSCTSKNTSDTLSQCLHLQLASCTSS